MMMSKSRLKSVKREEFLYMRSAPALSWRLDPDDSLSDWTLRVWSSDNPSQSRLNKFDGKSTCTLSDPYPADGTFIKTYFVHRSVLAVGPRSSEYFAQLFKGLDNSKLDARDDCSDAISCVSKNATKIELLSSAASCIPAMLDYLYAIPGTPLDIITQTAIPLRHLASSFGIKSLFHDTSEFIKNDLSPGTAASYLVQSRKFKNEKIASTAIKTIAKNFEEVKITALSNLPIQYLLDIVQSGYLKLKDNTKFCTKIAAYCRCRHEEITFCSLEVLTAPELMPTIIEEESLYFLDLLLSVKGSEVEDGKNLFSRSLEQAPKLLKILYGEKIDPNASGMAAYRQYTTCLGLYNSLPDRIKVKLLEKVSKCQIIDLQQPPLETKRNNLSRQKRARKKFVEILNEMEEMKATHEKKIEYLQQKLGRKDVELMQATAFKDEMEKAREKQISFDIPDMGCFGSI